MLKLIKKEGTRGGILGYDEIQILGARPWDICKQVVRCLYLVVTDGDQLTSLEGGDIAASLQDYDCFLAGGEPIEMDIDGMQLFFA